MSDPAPDPVAIPVPPAFLDACAARGIVFDDGDVERLGRYLALLLEANAQFNLTAVRDPDEAWMRHVADALELMPLLVAAEARTVCDVGSGGGFPALPLAIVLPDVNFTLVEATGKKARFLETTAARLGLENVDVVNDRAETVGGDREHHREHYDAVTCRAVGPLRVILELTVPLAREGGLVLAVKGERAAAEIAEAKEALHRLHALVIEVLETPTGRIVVVEKQRRTPKIYPRRPGEPKRAPIGGGRAASGEQ